MKKPLNYFITSILLFHAVVFVDCSPKSGQFIPGTIPDGKYDSEFPSRNSSDYLEKLADPVRMLNSIAYYEGYAFLKEDRVTLADIYTGQYEQKFDTTITFHNTTSGTATIIYSRSKKIAILTSAHIVDHPDTLFTYYKGEDNETLQYLESFAIKKMQRNVLIGVSEANDIKILAFDRDLDLAVLGKQLTKLPDPQISAFNFTLGSAKELNWGTFVYLIGYPKGLKMITRGIVSSPDRDKKHSFLIDALFNRGFSGGIVIAVRDGVPNFELVGMVNTVSASFKYILVPEGPDGASEFIPKIPYKGNIYVENQQEIDYGITYGISIEVVQEFLNEYKDKFEYLGYNFFYFFR